MAGLPRVVGQLRHPEATVGGRITRISSERTVGLGDGERAGVQQGVPPFTESQCGRPGAASGAAAAMPKRARTDRCDDYNAKPTYSETSSGSAIFRTAGTGSGHSPGT